MAGARNETQLQDSRVYALLGAMEGAEGEALERMMAEVDQQKRQASSSARKYADVILSTRRETHRLNASYHAANEKLSTIQLFDLTSVASPHDLEDRIEILRAFARESRALTAHVRDIRENFDSRLRAARHGKMEQASMLGAERGATSQQVQNRLNVQSREAEQVWADANVEALGALLQSFGAWKTTPLSGDLTWSDEAAHQRYDVAFQGVLHTYDSVCRHEAERTTLDFDVSKTSLLEARRLFVPHLRPPAAPRFAHAAAPPPTGLLQRVRYRSPAGQLAAYLSPDPRDGKRHPAVLWAHGGFIGIGSYLWDAAPAENDQSARSFREAGLVVMYPSLRGENDNPGRFEMFYGELDDLQAAASHLASLPYVDPDRIYLAGHSTGGTLVLLAAEAGDRFRAAFSFGGSPSIEALATQSPDTPFDPATAEELRLRSALHFVGALQRPTFYFEGLGSADFTPLRQMEARGAKVGAPFHLHLVDGGNHFSIVDPLTRLVTKKIVEDTGAECHIQITDDEVREAFAAKRPAQGR